MGKAAQDRAAVAAARAVHRRAVLLCGPAAQHAAKGAHVGLVGSLVVQVGLHHRRGVRPSIDQSPYKSVWGLVDPSDWMHQINWILDSSKQSG